MKKFPLLSKHDQQALNDAQHYMSMAELKHVCLALKLPHAGMKAAIIARIMHFIETGKILAEPVIPDISRAKKHQVVLLKPESLILYGSHKNDLATRLFFKKFIGEHFHFTAVGHDWIRARWLEGKPPTYQEFADFWEEARKANTICPKQEWAYLSFIQRFVAANPNASRPEITVSWKIEREKKVKEAYVLLKKIETP
ncbi:SAP domain-containing protein [Candidatus Dependentiae bacterium]|jgi:hypothetical protein|nr:SAP domain-containing protein [Candidatus Dependentiae bacterium]